MSATVVLVPILISAWPTLAASVVSVAASAGFTVVLDKNVARKSRRTVEIDMENMEAVGEALSHDDKIVVERAGARVTFSRDARGRFRTCVDGELDEDELRKIGEDLAGRVIQQYLYRRLTQELSDSGFVTLEEDKAADETIRLHVRRHQD